MEAVEEDQQDADAGGHAQETLVGVAVDFELAVAEGADSVLHLLVAAVKGREVEVGRCLGFRHVPVVGPEEVVDDDARPVPQDAGHVVGVRLVLGPLHD